MRTGKAYTIVLGVLATGFFLRVMATGKWCSFFKSTFCPRWAIGIRDSFRTRIERAIQFGGRYFLTYHRWAARKQVETCYPQFVEFLRLKKKYDPEERFKSDWYRHYKQMFADVM